MHSYLYFISIQATLGKCLYFIETYIYMYILYHQAEIETTFLFQKPNIKGGQHTSSKGDTSTQKEQQMQKHDGRCCNAI